MKRERLIIAVLSIWAVVATWQCGLHRDSASDRGACQAEVEILTNKLDSARRQTDHCWSRMEH